MTTYDVTVIGGGPGGYVAAIRAAQLGLKTAIVEKEHLGGVCLNWGCIPSKALLRNAEIANLLTRGKDFGFSFENLKLDYAVAHKRSRDVSGRLVKGVQFLMKKNKIDVYQGAGKLKDATHIEITAVENAPSVSGTAFYGRDRVEEHHHRHGRAGAQHSGCGSGWQGDHHLSSRVGDHAAAEVDRDYRRGTDRVGVWLRVPIVRHGSDHHRDAAQCRAAGRRRGQQGTGEASQEAGHQPADEYAG